jgi:hypothetical protein
MELRQLVGFGGSGSSNPHRGHREVSDGIDLPRNYGSCYLQANLVSRNVLIRGALTVGFINVDDGLIFGPPLVQAHLLESKRAVYPRIIVDPDVLETLKECPLLRAHDTFEEEMSYLDSVLQRDEDRELFLNYLNWLNENADDHHEHMQFLAVHKDFIEERILKLQNQDLDAAEKDKRAAKLTWLSKLHNAHVRSLNPQAVATETGVSRDALLTDESSSAILRKKFARPTEAS